MVYVCEFRFSGDKAGTAYLLKERGIEVSQENSMFN